jgi:hypothetical protein
MGNADEEKTEDKNIKKAAPVIEGEEGQAVPHGD